MIKLDILITTSIIFLLAGCGSHDGGSAPSSNSQDKPTDSTIVSAKLSSIGFYLPTDLNLPSAVSDATKSVFIIAAPAGEKATLEQTFGAAHTIEQIVDHIN